MPRLLTNTTPPGLQAPAISICSSSNFNLGSRYSNCHLSAKLAVAMSVRSMLGGRLNATASLISCPPPRMASQQLARFHSTAVRSSPTPASKLIARPHTRPAPALLCRPAGTREQSTTSQTSQDEVKLDWDSFFKLRASRRRYSLASSVATSLASTTIGVQVLSAQGLESLGAQVMGLDPFIVLGLATAACGAAGWLLGPMVGNGVWGLIYRRYKPSVVTVSFL